MLLWCIIKVGQKEEAIYVHSIVSEREMEEKKMEERDELGIIVHF